MTETTRVWDPLIRLFHWSLVVAFAVAWFTAEDWQPVHEFAGYTIVALIGLRLAWGIFGSRYARFSQFMCGPVKTISYMADMMRGGERRYLGHNPAGAAMILALLLTLSATAFTGWLMEDPARTAMLPQLPQIVAPAFAEEQGESEGGGAESESTIAELHEAFANLMLLLIALHVGGVVLASFRHRENLAHAMITGEKRVASPGDVA